MITGLTGLTPLWGMNHTAHLNCLLVAPDPLPHGVQMVHDLVPTVVQVTTPCLVDQATLVVQVVAAATALIATQAHLPVLVLVQVTVLVPINDLCILLVTLTDKMAPMAILITWVAAIHAQ